MGKIISMLKRITHRELSPEELAKTQIGSLTENRNEWTGIGEDVEYLTIEGEPSLRITKRVRETTSDISYGKMFMYTSFYAHQTIDYRYTKDGKLVEKVIQRGDIYTEREGIGITITAFNPPGCWKGQKVERTERKYPELVR